MRIAMCGAGGTGKTTTAKLLSEQLNIPFISSVTRGVLATFNITHLDMDKLSAEQRLEIQLANFNAKLSQELVNPHGIYDRTLADHFMYVLLHCSEVLSEDQYNIMCKQVQESLFSYDFLIFFPIYNWTPPKDEFRQFNFASRKLQELILISIIKESSYDNIPDEPVIARVARLKLWLKGIL